MAERPDGQVGAAGYESWFVSAHDPLSRRALWIRHTRHRPREGTISAATWCTFIDRDGGRPPAVIKEVFSAFPPDVTAGPGQFRGHATMGTDRARWDLAITGEQPPLRPLRPPILYRSPVPRTKLEATVPDGLVTGTLEIDSRAVSVSGWRVTVGHNWGSEHADTWVWLHAAAFGGAPEAWLELVLARIRVGPLRLPWTAMGALSAGGALTLLGGLGRRSSVDAGPGWLAADLRSAGARLGISVTAEDEEPVVVTYTDPAGGLRTVRHNALSGVELTVHRPGTADITLSSSCGAYEYGTSQGMPGITPRPLPEG
jgi:hypothetical protein